MKTIVYNEETFKAKINELYNNEIQIIGHYKGLSSPILAQDKFGIMQCKANYLLKYRPGIKAALNKTQYFMNYLKEVQPEIAEQLEPQSEYIAMKSKMLFKNKFGLVSVNPDALVHGHIPNIRSAVNRKEYFKNQLLFIYGNKYDFEITSTDRHKGKVVLICPIHGKQLIDSDGIFLGTGCPKCNKDVAVPNLFYLIRLYNNSESFYKLGISHKLKNGSISRFKSYTNLGYKIEIIKLVEFKVAIECKEFELKTKQLIKNNLYIPKNWKYNSSTEAFQDNLLETIINKIDNIEYDIVSTSSESQSSLLDGQEVTIPNEDI